MPCLICNACPSHLWGGRQAGEQCAISGHDSLGLVSLWHKHPGLTTCLPTASPSASAHAPAYPFTALYACLPSCLPAATLCTRRLLCRLLHHQPCRQCTPLALVRPAASRLGRRTGAGVAEGHSTLCRAVTIAYSYGTPHRSTRTSARDHHGRHAYLLSSTNRLRRYLTSSLPRYHPRGYRRNNHSATHMAQPYGRISHLLLTYGLRTIPDVVDYNIFADAARADVGRHHRLRLFCASTCYWPTSTASIYKLRCLPAYICGYAQHAGVFAARAKRTTVWRAAAVEQFSTYGWRSCLAHRAPLLAVFRCLCRHTTFGAYRYIVAAFAHHAHVAHCLPSATTKQTLHVAYHASPFLRL